MSERLFEDFSPVDKESWLDKIARDLKGKSPETLAYTTDEGIKMFPVLQVGDLPDPDWLSQTVPGQAPYTRGATLLMHAVEGWRIDQDTDQVFEDWDDWEATPHVSTTGHHMRGANLVQEIACALSMAVEKAAIRIAAGASADDVFSAMRIRFAVGSRFFDEIAKVRAFRRLYALVLSRYDLPQAAGAYMDIHAVTSAWRQSVLDAETNLLRATTQAMSAIFGGATRITILPHDHPTGDSSAEAQRIAHNIHLVLREEAHLARVVDPAGGAYHVEALTERLAEKAWQLFLDIEAMGGYAAAFANGKIAADIMAVAAKRLERVARGKETLLGVNRFPNPAESYAPAAREEASESAPYAMRAASNFEALRDRMQAHLRNGGGERSAGLLTYGHAVWARARAGFARNLFGCAGMVTFEADAFHDRDAAIAQLRAAPPAVVVLCSSDKDNMTEAPSLISRLRSEIPESLLVVAGEFEGWEAMKGEGLHSAIYAGMNIPKYLNEVLDEILEGKELRHEA